MASIAEKPRQDRTVSSAGKYRYPSIEKSTIVGRSGPAEAWSARCLATIAKGAFYPRSHEGKPLLEASAPSHMKRIRCVAKLPVNLWFSNSSQASSRTSPPRRRNRTRHGSSRPAMPGSRPTAQAQQAPARRPRGPGPHPCLWSRLARPGRGLAPAKSTPTAFPVEPAIGNIATLNEIARGADAVSAGYRMVQASRSRVDHPGPGRAPILPTAVPSEFGSFFV